MGRTSNSHTVILLTVRCMFQFSRKLDRNAHSHLTSAKQLCFANTCPRISGEIGIRTQSQSYSLISRHVICILKLLKFQPLCAMHLQHCVLRQDYYLSAVSRHQTPICFLYTKYACLKEEGETAVQDYALKTKV